MYSSIYVKPEKRKVNLLKQTRTKKPYRSYETNFYGKKKLVIFFNVGSPLTGMGPHCVDKSLTF